uniref:Carboxypeptidase n=1 Tax=Panagrolaimus superbus TaxID=310955 RepID=A0A914Y4D9_9BILA
MWMEWVWLICIFLGKNAAVEGAPEYAKIKNLPNLQFSPTFEQYSGYLPVNNGNQLFYWLTMAYENASTAPTLLYLNGGPGCSSMQGLLVEMGPFRILNYGAKVVENKYAWNRYANVLYLDAPAGVGYSLNLHKNYTFTDSQVASDNHDALKAFFTLFPELKRNAFFIGGESYAG